MQEYKNVGQEKKHPSEKLLVPQRDASSDRPCGAVPRRKAWGGLDAMCTWKMSQTSGFLQGRAAVSAVPVVGGHRRCRRGGAPAARARSARPGLPSATGQTRILYNFYIFPGYPRDSAIPFKAQIAAE